MTALEQLTPNERMDVQFVRNQMAATVASVLRLSLAYAYKAYTSDEDAAAAIIRARTVASEESEARMTAPPEATPHAIPLEHAALCVTCEAIFDTRVIRDTDKRTCRDHQWVRITRWLPPLDDAKEPARAVEEKV